MTKIILDETEYMQMKCRISDLFKENARLEVENYNLKLGNKDLQRIVDHNEIMSVNK